MRKHIWALGLSMLTAASAVQGAVIVEYSTTGLSGTTAPTSAAATTVATGVTGATALVRGDGILSAALANGFSAMDWTLSSSSTIAQTSNEYFGWSFTIASGFKASLSTLDMSMRRSAAASPDHFEVYVSTDGFATAGTLVASWQYLGRNSGTAPGTLTPFQWMTIDTQGQANGNPISTQDLSDDPILQNVAEGTTLSFRLYGFGNIGGAAASNTLALGRSTSTTPNNSGGPSIGGTITAVPEPTMIGCVSLTSLIALRRRRANAGC